jgi:hypothetical protein
VSGRHRASRCPAQSAAGPGPFHDRPAHGLAARRRALPAGSASSATAGVGGRLEG